jgi:hypothetical protein
MTLRFSRPRLDDLYSAPELAALAVLEAAADVAVLAVLAAHPDDDELDDDSHPDQRAARVLVDAARDVAACVNRYRLALVVSRQHRRDDLLPF